MSETFAQFIERRIHEAFMEAADAAGKQFDAEELLGVPQTIFAAETSLLNAWQRILAKLEAPDEHTNR